MNAPDSLPNATPPTVYPPVWRTLIRFPRPVWILFLGTFINKFGTFVLPFLALHLTRMGYSAGHAALAFGAYGVGHLLASAIGGYLADSIGRRQTIVLSMFSGAACMMALSQAEGLGTLIALALATGLAGELYKPASSALLADLTPENHRVTAYAAYRFAINAGWAFGPAVAGLLAQGSYFWLFLGDAVTSTLYGLIALFLLPRTKLTKPRDWAFALNAVSSLGEAFRAVAKNRRFIHLILATFAIGLIFLQMLSTLGLQTKAAGCSEATYGLVLALNGLLVVLFEIPLCAVTQRLPTRSVIAAGFSLMACGTGLLAWADAPGEFALAMAIFTGGEIISMPVALAYAANLAPDALRGRYMGVYGFTWAAALVVGPAIGMTVFAWNPVALWLGCGVIGLLAASVVLKDAPPARGVPASFLPPGPVSLADDNPAVLPARSAFKQQR